MRKGSSINNVTILERRGFIQAWSAIQLLMGIYRYCVTWSDGFIVLLFASTILVNFKWCIGVSFVMPSILINFHLFYLQKDTHTKFFLKFFTEFKRNLFIENQNIWSFNQNSNEPGKYLYYSLNWIELFPLLFPFSFYSVLICVAKLN